MLPFWVADMDLACPQAISHAIENRAALPVYGYASIPDAWAESYAGWFSKRHGWNLRPEELVYTNGVICALSSLVHRFSVPNEKVIVMTPVYSMFFNSIVNNGREPFEVELAYDGKEYHIDWEELESAFSDPQASLMILCNPHNPTGNLWSAKELRRIADLAEQYRVLIISDEVHCDVVRPGCSYTPFASVSEKAADLSLTLLSPSKAFNIAGIHSAAIAAKNPKLRHQAWRAVNTDEVGEPNVFSIPAAVAAYNDSEEWLDQMQKYVFENRKTASEFLESRFPVRCVKSDALYLMWIDVSAICHNSEELNEFLIADYGVRLSDGNEFRGNGKDFLRMNLACPKSMLKEGLDRLAEGLNAWMAAHQSAEIDR